MPELPEVETTRRGIEPHIVGKAIAQVLVRQPSLRWPVSPELSQALTGNIITRVSRRAKYLLFETRSGRMMVHLGMSGSLRITDTTSEIRKHDHIDIRFSDDSILRYFDPRRFGSVFWLPADESHVLLESLGPEPLSDEFDGGWLYAQSRTRKVAVKLFIMNSQIVVGVGNIYANEALHMAGIRPDRAANRISAVRYDRLADKIRQVLDSAIVSGGTTLKDFVREDGSPGYFKQQLAVYGRGGEPCKTCGTDLTETRLGSRTTVFCRLCQR
jgi:formamidopyrimidine-DNA glycosylase